MQCNTFWYFKEETIVNSEFFYKYFDSNYIDLWMTVASAKKVNIQQCGDHPSGIFNTNNYVCSGWGVSNTL